MHSIATSIAPPPPTPGRALASGAPSHVHGLGSRPVTRVGSFYLDRLGKLEKVGRMIYPSALPSALPQSALASVPQFRRQIYSLTLTRHAAAGLWLGLATVIEWPKVCILLPTYVLTYLLTYLLTGTYLYCIKLSNVT